MPVRTCVTEHQPAVVLAMPLNRPLNLFKLHVHADTVWKSPNQVSGFTRHSIQPGIFCNTRSVKVHPCLVLHENASVLL